ncbi:hypothetical protein ACLOJK_041360 [Asimina triloba]
MEDLSLSKLTKLEIRGFVIQCEQNNLPGLGQLPALKHLQIENVGLKKVGRELYYGNLSNDVVGGGRREAFAKLEELVLEKMSELEEGCSSSFSHLEEFTLDDSSESNGLPHLPNLKEFRIKRIRNEALPNGGWKQLAALREFEIDACFELKSLPDGLTQLQSLENLKIVGCDKVPLLPEGLGQLKKLQSF